MSTSSLESLHIAGLPSGLATHVRSHYVPHMTLAPTPFDPDAPGGGVTTLVRRNPADMSKTEMVEAIWGSDPRFSDGSNSHFVRTEGRAFPARRCPLGRAPCRERV